MLIPCKDIALELEKRLKIEVSQLKANSIIPKLVTILIGTAPDQLSFVKIKSLVAQKIGVEFELVHIEKVPAYRDFLKIVSKKASDVETSGIIIQQPMPENFLTDEVYDLIPKIKEIESFRHDSTFHFPLSLAVLTGFKYCILKDKQIIIAGKGITGGKPIAKTLKEIGVAYKVADSKTENADKLYQDSDIIITATGKNILNRLNIKKGVMLLNVGLRKENDKLKGDYDEENVSELASFYTKTPGGLGPLDVLYLFKNVIEAAKSQANLV
jgi:methylenetetrahydrofolate dehydrogenase (NADP+)/methenyltetrahydrofolate cyclohydrolase